MYCSINRWVYFWENSTLATTWFKKEDGLVFKGGSIFGRLQYIQYTSIAHTHTHTYTSTQVYTSIHKHTHTTHLHLWLTLHILWTAHSMDQKCVYIPSLQDSLISTWLYNNNCERDSPTAEGISLAFVCIGCCVCAASRVRNRSFSFPWYFYHDAAQPVNMDTVKVSSTTTLYVSLPESLQYFVCIFKATLCSPIWQRASTTAFHVGCLAFRSQWPNVSCLQRSLPSPRKSWSIVRSSWSSSPNLTPSKCQFTTESSAFESSFRVGVAGGEKRPDHTHTCTARDAKCSNYIFVWPISKAELTFRRSLTRGVWSFRHLSCLLFQQTSGMYADKIHEPHPHVVECTAMPTWLVQEVSSLHMYLAQIDCRVVFYCWSMALQSTKVLILVSAHSINMAITQCHYWSKMQDDS